MSEEHKERYFEPVKSFLDNHDLSSQAINDAKLMNSKGSIYKAYEVDCLSMQQIMNEINIGHINLWSLGEMSSNLCASLKVDVITNTICVALLSHH